MPARAIAGMHYCTIPVTEEHKQEVLEHMLLWPVTPITGVTPYRLCFAGGGGVEHIPTFPQAMDCLITVVCVGGELAAWIEKE